MIKRESESRATRLRYSTLQYVLDRLKGYISLYTFSYFYFHPYRVIPSRQARSLYPNSVRSPT